MWVFAVEETDFKNVSLPASSFACVVRKKDNNGDAQKDLSCKIRWRCVQP